MSVPDYAEMGRELEANRDATLVNAANRGVNYHKELESANERIGTLCTAIVAAVEQRNKEKARAEAAERKLAHLQAVLDERLRRIECLNSKLQHAYPALQSAKTEESTKALAEMDRITGEYQQALAQTEQPQEPQQSDLVETVERLRAIVRSSPETQKRIEEYLAQLPGEDPPFKQCQCSACVALREKA